MSTADLWLMFWLAVLAFALIAYLFSQRREEERQRKKQQAAQEERRKESERQWRREQQELVQRREQQLAQTRPEKSVSDVSLGQTGRNPGSGTIQREVWLRDRGRCVTCGSRENLKLNHIVPPSKGGSFTADNLHLLCRACSQSMES